MPRSESEDPELFKCGSEHFENFISTTIKSMSHLEFDIFKCGIEISCSIPRLESGDPYLFQCGIEHIEKAISAVQCPIWNQETHTALNVALNTSKRLSQRFNAALAFPRPVPL